MAKKKSQKATDDPVRAAWEVVKAAIGEPLKTSPKRPQKKRLPERR